MLWFSRGISNSFRRFSGGFGDVTGVILGIPEDLKFITGTSTGFVGGGYRWRFRKCQRIFSGLRGVLGK